MEKNFYCLRKSQSKSTKRGNQLIRRKIEDENKLINKYIHFPH